MKIIDIKKKELLNFCNSEIFEKSEIKPISLQRAISQTKNPRAEENDVLLTVAINENNQIIGYIGALPEKINGNENQKIAWNSCWWVDKNANGNVSMQLFFRFLKNWNFCVMMRDMTEHTKKIILSLKGFFVSKQLNGKKYFFRLNIGERTKFKYLGKIVDTIFNSRIMILNLFYCKLPKDLHIEFDTKIKEEYQLFIDTKNTNEIFKRDTNNLNWILENPWIRQGDVKNKDEKKYFFSTVKKSFSNKICIIKSKNEVISLILFKEINKNLETPYIYFDKKYSEIVANFIIYYILKNDIISFFTFNDEIQKQFDKKILTYFYSKKIIKEFVIHEKMKNYLKDEFDFQDGEGDFVFA